jgi:hypothetical protein
VADLTLKVLASLLQMHGPGATIQSDNQGIESLLNDIQAPMTSGETPAATEVVFRRGAFVRAPGAGGFRRGAGYAYPGGFRRGAFRRY